MCNAAIFNTFKLLMVKICITSHTNTLNKEDSDKNALITGRIEVDCLKMYLSAEGRLWRKLTANKEGKLLATKQKVGKNTVANYSKDILSFQNQRSIQDTS